MMEKIRNLMSFKINSLFDRYFDKSYSNDEEPKVSDRELRFISYQESNINTSHIIDEISKDDPDYKYIISYGKRLSIWEKVIRYIIVFGLFLAGLDCYGIYKSSSKVKNRYFNSAELQLPITNLDRWRQRFRFVFLILMIYVIIKLITINLIELILHSFVYSKLNNNNFNNYYRKHYHSSSQTITTTTTTTIEPLTHMIMNSYSNKDKDYIYIKLKHLTEDYNSFKNKTIVSALELSFFIGNPLSDLYGICLMINSILIITLSHSAIFLPYYYENIKPMNALHLRLLLYPAREIRRIDLIIHEQLDYMKSIITNRTFNVGDSNNSQMYVRYFEKQNINELKEVINDLKLNHVETMRPAACDKEFHSKHFGNVQKFLFYVLLILLPWTYYLPKILLSESINNRCSDDIKKIKSFILKKSDIDCQFSYQDILLIIEISLSVLYQSFWFALETVMILSNVSSQLESVRIIKEDMDICLRSLRFCETINKDDILLLADNHNQYQHSVEDLINDVDSIRSRYHNEQIVARLATNNRATNKSEKSELMLDSILLRTLIKLKISIQDIQKNNDFVSQMISSWVGIIAPLLVFTIFSGIMSDITESQQIKSLRTALLLWVLLVINVILLSCAYSFARTSDVSKLAWSALAQMLIRLERRKREFYNDFIAVNWCKYVLSGSLIESSSVKLFNMLNVKFRSILEFNFILISVASLLKSL